MDQACALGVGGNLLSREVQGFAGPEYGCFKIHASPGEDFFMAWKAQGRNGAIRRIPDLEETRLHSRIA